MTTAGNGWNKPFAPSCRVRALQPPPPLQAAIAAGYAAGKTDEFLPATVIGDYAGMRDDDGLFFLNFRADRAREILAAIGDPAFSAFETGPRPRLTALLGMVDYSTAHNAYMTAVFPKQDIVNTLGEWVAKQGLHPVPSGRNREIPPCHLLPERRPRGALCRRRSPHGALAQGRDL